MKHTCDRTVPCHFQVQTRLWLWRRWFELVFELLAYEIMLHLTDLGWDLADASGKHTKKCEKPWFYQENHLQMVGFADLIFQEGNLLWRETAYERDDNLALCNGIVATWRNLQNPSTFEPRLIQPPDCYSMWKDSPQPRPKTLQEHGKTQFSFSIFRQKYPHHSATTSSVGQQGSRPRKDLPRSVELFFDAASPAQAYVKLCETICHFPRHCIALEVTWRAFFPGDVCSGTQNLPSCHFDGGNAHFWWVNSSAVIPLYTPGSWVEFFVFVRFCAWNLPLV